MQVYVSGPLQAAADLPSARALYLAIGAALEECGHRAYVPHLHTDPEATPGLEPASVYDRDVEALLSADAVVAHVGAPSTGVGAELAIAHQAGLRVLGLRRTGEPVSRFAQGLIERAGGAVLEIGDMTNLALLLRDALAAAGHGPLPAPPAPALARGRAG